MCLFIAGSYNKGDVQLRSKIDVNFYLTKYGKCLTLSD